MGFAEGNQKNPSRGKQKVNEVRKLEETVVPRGARGTAPFCMSPGVAAPCSTAAQRPEKLQLAQAGFCLVQVTASEGTVTRSWSV